MDALTKLRAARRERELADAEFKAAISAAREEGMSFRQIGKAAGISHVAVLKMINGSTPMPAAYVRGHLAVARKRGTPSSCEICRTTDPERIYEWASISGDFGDASDYVRLCRKCHRLFDREKIGNDPERVLKILRGE